MRRIVLFLAVIGLVWVVAKVASFVLFALAYIVPVLVLAAVGWLIFRLVSGQRRQDEVLTLDEWLILLGEEVR